VAIAAVILAVGTAQAGDLITFIRMVLSEGPAAEANPIVAQGIDSVGLPTLVFAKVCLFVLVVAIVEVLAHAGAGRRARTAAFVATFAVAAGIVGAFSNVFAMA
jgi:hypothetical protein